MKSFGNAEVAAVFAQYPAPLRKRLLDMRKTIFKVASKTEGVGKLEETLKWGEPAYVTVESGSGSTIRIDRRKHAPNQYAIYFNCQTNLVDTFRMLFPTSFKFEGNRCIVFDENERVPAELALCIEMALTYHMRRRGPASTHGPGSTRR